MADYLKQISSLSSSIAKAIKKIKDTNDLAFLTKVVEEIMKDSSLKNKRINKFFIRDAIIYAATNKKIVINTSGKQLLLELNTENNK